MVADSYSFVLECSSVTLKLKLVSIISIFKVLCLITYHIDGQMT